MIPKKRIPVMRGVKQVLFFTFFIIIVSFVIYSIEVRADNGGTIVHITATGKCYHREDCYHLRSDYEITLYEAVIIKGYNPCLDCDPPIYDGSEPLHEKMEKSQGGSSSGNRSRPSVSQKKSSPTKSLSTDKDSGEVIKTKEEGKIEEKSLSTKSEENNKTNTYYVIILAGILLWTSVRIVALFKDKDETNDRKSLEKNKIKDDIKQSTDKKLDDQDPNLFFELYSYKDPISLVKVPKGMFIKNGFPCTLNSNKGIYGDFTVYVSQRNPRVLHMNSKCSGTTLVPVNFFQVCKLPRCKKCATGYRIVPGNTDWYDEYLKIVEAKTKYNIP
ncbi:hypothetical protein [Butyrivibrio sp. MC2013]|uniref:hypothetical protein n=1 Tax=Butyrivibrio sp. MC2013 TaxID=1280686 RepID=UPI000409081A|nr:hypothetical protein [Butyrivibrio sp. MC2013]